METATAVIETRGLVKRFAEANAVAGSDLAVPPGGVYGSLGPNGAGLIELFVVNLPIFAPGEALGSVPQLSLTTSIRALTGGLGHQTHAIALSDAPTPSAAIELPLFAVAGIVGAWCLLFLVLADRRIRTMDVTE